MKPTKEQLERIYEHTMEVVDSDDVTVRDLIYRAILEWEKIRSKIKHSC